MSQPILFVADDEVRAHPTALFPGTTDADWSAHPELLDADGRLLFAVGSFLVRTPGATVLVDLGLGGGRLLDNLAALGVAPEQVDLVVYTHLHRDHVGWTSRNGRLTFGAARHVVHRAEWEHWQGHDSPVGPDPATVLEPLRDTVEFVADGDEPAEGVHVLALPGHTPGHLGVVVERDGEQVVIAGDALHSPAQVTHPDWCFGSDHDPVRAAASRRALVARYGVDLLACGHFPPTMGGWPSRLSTLMS